MHRRLATLSFCFLIASGVAARQGGDTHGNGRSGGDIHGDDRSGGDEHGNGLAGGGGGRSEP